MVRILGSVPESMDTAGSYLTRVSLVSAAGPALDPGTVSRIRTHPDVARVIQERGLSLELPPFIGEHHLFGVSQADMQALMDATDLRLKEGRLLQPRSNELVLTEEMAAAIGLQIGDQLDDTRGRDSTGESWYEAILTPLVLVGVLEGPVWLGFVFYEYVSSHGAFSAPWAPGLVVVAHPGQKAQVDTFLETEIASGQSGVMTRRLLTERSAGLSAMLYLVFGIVDLMVAAVMALVVGAIHQISQARRLAEFGVLNALGHSKSRLIRRASLEAVAMAGSDWVLGLALAWLLFALLRLGSYAPRGMPLDQANLTPIWFSLPIPLATIAVVALSTRRTFTRLDAVAIVEREGYPIYSDGTGYIEEVDPDLAIPLANKRNLVVRLVRKPGDFVQAGDRIALAWPPQDADQEVIGQIRSCYRLGNERIPTQDIEYAVNQLVEMAVRAMSAAINDPYTAMTCLDHLGAGLAVYAEGTSPDPHLYDSENRLRVIFDPLAFSGLLDGAFNMIRHASRDNADVLLRLLDAIERVATRSSTADQRAELLRQVRLVEAESQAGSSIAWDQERVGRRCADLAAKLSDG